MVRAALLISVESVVETWISTMEHHAFQRRTLGEDSSPQGDGDCHKWSQPSTLQLYFIVLYFINLQIYVQKALRDY